MDSWAKLIGVTVLIILTQMHLTSYLQYFSNYATLLSLNSVHLGIDSSQFMPALSLHVFMVFVDHIWEIVCLSEGIKKVTLKVILVFCPQQPFHL